MLIRMNKHVSPEYFAKEINVIQIDLMKSKKNPKTVSCPAFLWVYGRDGFNFHFAHTPYKSH